jgi:hypothetical protein
MRRTCTAVHWHIVYVVCLKIYENRLELNVLVCYNIRSQEIIFNRRVVMATITVKPNDYIDEEVFNKNHPMYGRIVLDVREGKHYDKHTDLFLTVQQFENIRDNG